MNSELKELLNHVKKANPNSPEAVQTAINTFFHDGYWSVLSDEWHTKMTDVEKNAFCIKVYKQVK